MVVMQATSSPRERVRPNTLINVGRFIFAVLDVSNRGYVFLRDHRKWILVIVAASISFQSYFVRELVAALFFFTVFYVILATLVALYILFDHALYSGILWLASVGRSFYPFLHNHLASPSRVLSLLHVRPSDCGQRLAPAFTSAVTTLLPKNSLGTTLALGSTRPVGGPSCSELHYLAGRKARAGGK